jgi:hypothetical protein
VPRENLEHTQTEAEKIFAQVDTDRSGTIEDHELLLHLLGTGVDEDSISELFRTLDAHRDGHISRDEWNMGFETHTRRVLRGRGVPKRKGHSGGNALEHAPETQVPVVAVLGTAEVGVELLPKGGTSDKPIPV